jgi:radical SAM superfamily enzyme YgiQ (UPF0313 family)
VQGRKSRRRTADDIEAVIRGNVAQGIYAFFITDDNFARNKDWEALLDRVIELRQKEGWGLSFTIQVDTLCHKLPNFIEKCAKAGVRRCFIGLENINPDSLLGAKKRQNKITDYRGMMLAWKQAKIMTVGGYILGFPNDTLASIVPTSRSSRMSCRSTCWSFFPHAATRFGGSQDAVHEGRRDGSGPQQI